jgi:hypothetical protein
MLEWSEDERQIQTAQTRLQAPSLDRILNALSYLHKALRPDMSKGGKSRIGRGERI